MRPNVLWLMSDQHNANCLGAAGHPDVRTPNLDALAADGVRFTQAYCNNPICAPSRISMMTGQYPHTTGITGNDINDLDLPHPQTLATLLRSHRYQTAMIGKAHMINAWDRAGFEHIRYCDLCDAALDDPLSCHYYRYLVEHGLGDAYDLGCLPKDHPGRDNRLFVSSIPFEHSLERWTGNQALEFLQTRDARRPFFMQMSFQRPHDPFAPAPEKADLYDPTTLHLPDSAVDLFERHFAGKPAFQQKHISRLHGCGYPFVARDRDELRRQLACYLGLVTVIDAEFGRVIDHLKQTGDYENTIICYVADHGDFAGEHGLMLKNFGIYESIHRIPFLLHWPAGPREAVRQARIEGVDLYPTLCELAGIDVPASVEGRSRVAEALNDGPGREAVVCEWDFGTVPQNTVFAVRTSRHRLVYYLDAPADGELYDCQADPGELENLYGDPVHRAVREQLLWLLLNHVGRFRRNWSTQDDVRRFPQTLSQPTRQLHKAGRLWSEIQPTLPQPNA